MKKWWKPIRIAVVCAILFLWLPNTFAGINVRSEILLWRVQSRIEAKGACTLGDVFRFSWDEAYVDCQPYGEGEMLKERFGLEFDIKATNRDHLQRMLFFRRGRLVREFRYPVGTFDFPEQWIVLKPEDILDRSFFIHPSASVQK